MPDVILNTHTFDVLFDQKTLNKLDQNGCHVYVAKCAWEKELRGVRSLAVNLLSEAAGKLRKKFHVKTVNEEYLPDQLKNELTKNGASSCDIEIATLAFERVSKSGQEVILITNDPHFQLSKLALERCRIFATNKEDF